MELLKLAVVFSVIVAILKLNKPLATAIAGACIATSLLYGIGLVDTLQITVRSLTSFDTVSLLLVFYLVIFMQRMLEKRDALRTMLQSLNGIFNNRRVNAALAPGLVGLLPSPAAIPLCGAIIEETAENHLTAEEKSFVTVYYRHIPESFIPTYPAIILGAQLSGVALSSYVYYMLPMAFVLVGLGYIHQLRKLPKDTGQPKSENRGKDFVTLCRNLWPIALIVIMVVAFEAPLYIAALTSVALYMFAGKFTWSEIRPMFFTAFESKLLTSTAAIMVFRDIINATGVIEILPDFFYALPIPPYLVFFLIFFLGTLVCGQLTIIATCLPLAFGTIPNAGAPLLVLLLSTASIANKVSPTHICLAIAAEYFKISIGALIKKTIPVAVSFSVILIGYYLFLTTIWRTLC